MKRILVISPIPTHPLIAGNRTRICRLIASLKAMGHDVHFVYVNTEPENANEQQMRACWGDNFSFVPYQWPKRSLSRYARRLQFLFEKGFREIQPVDYRYDPSLDDFLKSLLGRKAFDVVMVEYIFWSRALNCFDEKVLKLLDTHDVFARRHLMLRETGERYGWYCTTTREEAKALSRADVVIAIQEQEEGYFSKLTDKKVITVRHIASLHRTSAKPVGKQILFIGSDNDPNVYGVRQFNRNVLPKIRAVIPDVQFLIAGKICDKIENDGSCIKVGVVENLAELYESVDLLVNPVQFSTGLSIKTIEALGHGKPVVCTSAGSRGMEDAANKAFLVADTPEDFVQAVLKLLNDRQLMSNLSQAAYGFVEQWNTQSLQTLANVINDDQRYA